MSGGPFSRAAANICRAGQAWTASQRRQLAVQGCALRARPLPLVASTCAARQGEGGRPQARKGCRVSGAPGPTRGVAGCCHCCTSAFRALPPNRVAQSSQAKPSRAELAAAAAESVSSRGRQGSRLSCHRGRQQWRLRKDH